MKFEKNRNAFYVVASIIFIFGLFLIIPNSIIAPAADSASQAGTISYQGVEGKNALELLKDNHEVTADVYDFGELVTGIDGQGSDETNFWAFFVNGEMAQVGASDYQTKPEDTIEWKLEPLT